MQALIKFILSLFSTQKSPEVDKKPQIELKYETSEPKKVLKPHLVPDAEPWENVNWAMPEAKISKFFTVKEALWLNTDKKLALPTAEQRKNIYLLAQKMDTVRRFLGVPLVVTSWLRPEAYNVKIGGSKRSQHIKGLAIDFVPKGMSCENARQKLLPKLVHYGMRMEDNAHIKGGNWVHLDLGEVVYKRFFKP